MKKPQKKKQLNKYAQYSGIAFQMAATIFIGVFIGSNLDKKYPNKRNIYTLICSLVFTFAALYSVIKQVSNISKNKDE
jgi:F0F1-type ATP synthase assembly protein I